MFQDIIVVVPGIFGSRLEHENGDLAYDLSIGSLWHTLRTLTGPGLTEVSSAGEPLDGVRATALFNYQMLPGFFGVDDYDTLLDRLRRAAPDPKRQVLTFPYDWRGSNRFSAERLERFIRPILHQWRKDSGNADAKVWFVCHSMGGLVARYFCEYLGGSDITRELVTIGTPHRGAAKALGAIVDGMSFVGGLVDLSTFVRSLPSVYELLPLYPVLSPEGAVVDSPQRLADWYGMGNLIPAMPGSTSGAALSAQSALPNLDAAALRRALEFHAAIREPIIQRIQKGLADPYSIRAFFNRRQSTVSFATQRSDPPAEVLALHDRQATLNERGDGTVPGFAALPVEWLDSSRAIAVPEKHVAMPSAATVYDNLINWMRPLDARVHMDGGSKNSNIIGLLTPPIVRAGERPVVTLDAMRSILVEIHLSPVSANIDPEFKWIHRTQLAQGGESTQIELPVAFAGSWRICVRAEERSVGSVADYFFAIAD